MEAVDIATAAGVALGITAPIVIVIGIFFVGKKLADRVVSRDPRDSYWKPDHTFHSGKGYDED